MSVCSETILLPAGEKAPGVSPARTREMLRSPPAPCATAPCALSAACPHCCHPGQPGQQSQDPFATQTSARKAQPSCPTPSGALRRGGTAGGCSWSFRGRVAPSSAQVAHAAWGSSPRWPQCPERLRSPLLERFPSPGELSPLSSPGTAVGAAPAAGLPPARQSRAKAGPRPF